ncbi:dihydrolipoyl dehydrogenase [Alteribacillus sp. YIM 98480]|uniref:dihydrolipoyl dehydrogenase n=1 Tax=Alteribacillus sp. YIM 98480 TaxID=2606599 RepID=UPI00131B62CE|nr:dihydrolipoyl dehydrogenase [Alteribacillus sp. YIM 98480]
MKHYDVIVIGGGPGGYVAAIRASKLGSSVALIESRDLGGTCLNRGCIPSKTLLHHAEVIEQIKRANTWGIETGKVSMSLEKMMMRKDQVIKKLRTGVSSLLEANKISVYEGIGYVKKNNEVHIKMQQKEENIKGNNIICAMGSIPEVPMIQGLEEVKHYTSDTIFNITEIPDSLVIIGGGVIGIEFANIFASLNTKVTIVELGDRIAATEDKDVSDFLREKLTKIGVQVKTKTVVEKVKQTNKGVVLSLVTAENEETSLQATEILVATGRKPNVGGLKELNLEMNNSFVSVNDRMETSEVGIYAVGDLVGGWQLAHVASAEGLVAAENAAGNYKKIDYSIVPRCIYTLPEAASVGMTEEEAQRKKYDVKVELVYNTGNGKALSMGESEGFVKIIADKKHGEILGVAMVGSHVTEMISEASLSMHLEGTVEELTTLIHPHPSLSEGMYEAALTWSNKGIHRL